MKTILCYGDSNTYGTNPSDWSRYDIHTRWPGVLRDRLGDGFHVIEEGCGGRTTICEDAIESTVSGSKSGLAYLRPCLNSHKPLDLMILLLGTNDLKAKYNLTAEEIARGVSVLIQVTQSFGAGCDGIAPKVLLVAPPPVGPLEHTVFGPTMSGAQAKSSRFGDLFEAVAQENQVAFFDAGTVIRGPSKDGLHWPASDHQALALALLPHVRACLES